MTEANKKILEAACEICRWPVEIEKDCVWEYCTMCPVEAELNRSERQTTGWEPVHNPDWNVYGCKTCGFEMQIIEGTPEENTFFYCPHCGVYTGGKERT